MEVPEACQMLYRPTEVWSHKERLWKEIRFWTSSVYGVFSFTSLLRILLEDSRLETSFLTEDCQDPLAISYWYAVEFLFKTVIIILYYRESEELEFEGFERTSTRSAYPAVWLITPYQNFLLPVLYLTLRDRILEVLSHPRTFP